MAPIPYYMQYIVWFKQQADYDFALGLSNGEPILRIPPDTVAALFGLQPFPNYPSGDVSQIPVSISFGHFFPGMQIGFPNPTGVFLDAIQQSFYVDCQPGTPASIWPCPADDSHDAIFYWEAVWNFNRGAGIGANPPPSPTAIAQRRWIDGAEIGAFLEGGGTISQNVRCKCASRVPGGRGFAFRGAMTSAPLNHIVNQFRAGLATKTSWERIYFRARQTGSDNATIWRCRNSVQGQAGCFLRYTTAGTIRVIDVTGFSVERDQGLLITPIVGQWYKIDVFLKYGDGTVGSGKIRIHVDGVDTLSYSSPDNSGMSLNGNHASSDIGPTIGASVDTEFDVDDWICSDLPANIDSTTLLDVPGQDYPIDFLLGSRVREHPTDPNTGSSTNWTGNRGVFNQGVTPQTALVNQLTSTTALARLEGLTDLTTLDLLDTQFVTIGIASALIGLYSSNAANTDGQLGYKLAGGADVLAVIDQINTLIARGVGYLPSGAFIPAEASPFSIVHTKSNDANLDTTVALTVVAEHLGVWGPEDDLAFESLGPRDFIHNSPYYNSPWSWLSSGTESPVYAVGFTYVGNGGYQEFAMPAPVHFIRIRQTSVAAQGGITWFASSHGATLGQRDRVIPNLRVWTDQTTGECFMSVSGNDADVNQSGITFQVIAFCDPGMRFLLCDQFVHSQNATQPIANPLILSNFLPECAFAQEMQTESVSNNSGLSFKGPGDAGNSGSFMTGAVAANWGTFSLGFVNSRSDLHASLAQALACWRSTEPGCTGTMVQILQYTGNGSNPRNITLTPTSGRVPLWVLVVPTNASTSIYRDPSHAGANSSQWLGTVVATGITAVGVDQITVNALLNTNTIVYNIFAICGDTAAMTNGEYTNLYCALPTGGPFAIPPEFVPGPNVIGDGGIILNGAAPLTLLKDVSGIYTLVPGKRNDSLIDRQAGQPSVDVEIPDPTFKSGYIGG